MNFRHVFEKIKQLASFKVQRIALTASLPYRLENQFLIQLAMPLSTRIIRARSDQPHISFVVVHVEIPATTPTRLAIDISKLLEAEFLKEDQIGIIFCNSVEEVDAVANWTHCSSHSKLGEEKRANEVAWKSGKKRWIAATTGLMHGVDAPNVGAVIFVDLPYGLLNFYQGSGRAGRDGRHVWSVLIDTWNSTQLKPRVRDIATDYECITEGYAFITQKNDCRRLEMSRLLDNRDTRCTDLPGCHLCDNCDPMHRLKSSLLPLILDKRPMNIPPVSSHVAKARLTSLEVTLEPPSTSTSSSATAVVATPTDSSGSHQIQSTFSPDSPDAYDAFNASLGDVVLWDELPDIAAVVDIFDVQSGPPVLLKNQSNALSKSLGTVTPPPAPPHLAPPTSNAPSMSVLTDTQLYHAQRNKLHEKVDLIHIMAQRLKGKCAICWAMTGNFVIKHDQLWVKCGGNRDYKPVVGNWTDFKRTLKYTQYGYCFKCGLPQASFKSRPDIHDEFKTGRTPPCPLSDLVILLVLYVRNDVSWWAAAVDAFPSLTYGTTNVQYAAWLTSVDSLENFNNSIELALWLWVTKSQLEISAH